MDNLIKILVISTILVFAYGVYVFASDAFDKITKNENVNVVINSEAVSIDTPIIIKNNVMLLPLRAIITKLGVQNDNKHIVWKGKDQSVTIYKDNIKIYLKINFQETYINKEIVKLDSVPILYKGKTYVPMDFVAESLEKKVLWDNETRSLLISDKNESSEVKDLLNNAISKMNKSKGFIMNYTFKDPNSYSNGNYSLELKVNRNSKIIYGKSMDDKGNLKEEFIYSGNKAYRKNDYTEWLKKDMGKGSEQYIADFLDVENFISKVNDSFTASMKKVKDDDDTKEIVLSGRAYPINMPSKADMFPLADVIQIDDFKTIIVIDKNTGLVKNMFFETYSKNTQNNAIESVSCFTEFNFPEGEIDIKIPQVRNAN
ncbi:MAG: copper amine oxidase N-terminal domain-containing protein [Ignavibacteriales bacterium]